MTAEYFIGLDLGQTGEFTALAVVERAAGNPEQANYALRYLERFPLGTAYGQIVSSVVTMAGKPPLFENATLVVDQTGVGGKVVNMLRQAPFLSRVVPVTITAGSSVVATEDGAYHVPKHELVTDLQVLLQSRRLQIARNLRDAKALVKELTNFRVKINLSKQDPFVAWREGPRDDQVFAVALACWLAEREPAWGPDAIGIGIDPWARIPKGVCLTDDPWGSLPFRAWL